MAVTPPWPGQVIDVVKALFLRRTELGSDLASRIRAEVDFYVSQNVVGLEELTTVAEGVVVAVLERFSGTKTFDLSIPERIGRERAAAGVPLTAVIDAYRVGAIFIWRTIADDLLAAGISAPALATVTDQLWEAQSSFTRTMSEAYRTEATARALTEQTERAALVDALLTGRVMTRATQWEVADLLHLPRTGPFVVVAAGSPRLGRVALPAVEARLKAAGVDSAWHLLPDLEVGIVHIADRDGHLALDAALAGHLNRRIGVSPEYDEIVGTAEALRFARIALHSAPATGGVRRFEDEPIAVMAAAEPDVAERVASALLAPLGSMRGSDREILVETLDSWLHHHGSAEETAQALFCHPNTVRSRLRRIEQRTGRSLSDPRDSAELYLAVQVLRNRDGDSAGADTEGGR